MLEFFVDLWHFARKHKKLWIIPIILVMVLAGTLIFFVQASAVNPLIYTLF